MTCRVLINPTTFEVWIKMHTDNEGKERVEILAPRLIEQFTRRGMEVPHEYRTQEMRDKNIRYLKLDELEKNPGFFTRVFKETVCKTRLLYSGYYWKDAEDYIDLASEELEQDEREMQIMIADKKTKVVLPAQPEVPSLEEKVEQSTEEMQKLTLSKKVAKTVSKTPQVANHTQGFKNPLHTPQKKHPQL
ncbi:MAG: hypothetical protein QRY71_01065 [Candidatus Rhabdochlamydia sp.]